MPNPHTTFTPVSESVTIGGRVFTVSALPCGVMRREVMPLADRFLGGEFDAESFGTLARLCHMSVSRAEPELTLEAMEDSLMLAEMALLFQHVVRVSGLMRGNPGGEAQGPQMSPASGATSTGT